MGKVGLLGDIIRRDGPGLFAASTTAAGVLCWFQLLGRVQLSTGRGCRGSACLLWVGRLFLELWMIPFLSFLSPLLLSSRGIFLASSVARTPSWSSGNSCISWTRGWKLSTGFSSGLIQCPPPAPRVSVREPAEARKSRVHSSTTNGPKVKFSQPLHLKVGLLSSRQHRPPPPQLVHP